MKALAMLLLLAGSAQASVVTKSYDLSTNVTALDQFNPALGTLSTVELRFKNVDIQSTEDISLPETKGVGTQTSQNQASIVAPGIGVIEPLNSFVFRSSVRGVNNLTNFGLPESFSLFPLTLPPYIGLGTVPFSLTSAPKLLFDNPAPGILPSGTTDDITGCLKVIYTYNTSTVTPEPKTIGLALIGIVCVAGYRYRRHGRSC